MPIPEAWEDTLGWETEDDDEGVSDLTFSNHSSCLLMNEQLESVEEVVAGLPLAPGWESLNSVARVRVKSAMKAFDRDSTTIANNQKQHV